ncbi:MAG: acyloxyacyl hydrolase [Mangrovibacterium sp.]
MKTKLLLFASLFLFSGIAHAQLSAENYNKKNVLFFAPRAMVGYVLPTNDFLKGANNQGSPINWYNSQSLGLAVQTTGNREWHHVLNFPYYGGGVYTAGFPQDTEMGRPFAIYGYMGIPLKRTEKHTFGYELAFGFATNWDRYDPVTNPNNITIGSYSTVYIGANLVWSWEISPLLDLRAGVGFTHFSNGAMRKPNKGLNLAAPLVELSYRLEEMPKLEREVPPPYKQHNEIAIQASFSAKQEEYGSSVEGVHSTIGNFRSYNLSTAYMRQITWKNKFGVGVDVSYDTQGALTTSQDEHGNVMLHTSDKFSDRFVLSPYGTYEFVVNRLSLASSLGFYLYRQKPQGGAPFLYQRIGLKYHFKNDMFMSILVRAHSFSVADLIEWGVGYRIKWGKGC